MLLTRKSVELLAPVGTWEVLEAAIDAGADAVYLGGKRFNMRMHRTDANFDDEKLARAIEYAHKRNVSLYVTVNNLISDRELDNMRSYLQLLDKIKPDALIVQDLAILKLAHEMNLSVPLHASVMMNTHNEYAVRTLQEYGITRVVVNREMSLAQMSLLKERTGIEVEYFIHGDMCIAHSGQCFHSGIVFGQSSNRGRCLKPCRWPYQLVDEATGQPVTTQDPGPYKLALKDMCMYLNLPELIQAGVCSFKIEGRMRTADFVRRVVQVYRKAIDRYIADPAGYYVDPKDWEDLYSNRSRDFSTCYALGKPGASGVGYTGKREPRFFSQAVREAGMDAPVFVPKEPVAPPQQKAKLAVRVADAASVLAACQNGADVVYVGGESFRPHRPWSLNELKQAVEAAKPFGTQIIVTTPRVAMERECGELAHFFQQVDAAVAPQGLMVSNAGTLRLARKHSQLPLHADFSFNVFNQLTTAWLKENGVSGATLSIEATHEQATALAASSHLPLEMIVHGPLEAMVMDHELPTAVLSLDNHANYDPSEDNRHYALLDSAGQQHPLRIDQYNRNHVLFAKDLCLLPYLHTLPGIGQFRIEGQHYTPELVGLLTKTYRQTLDAIATQETGYAFEQTTLDTVAKASPRPLGVGAFRYRVSR